MAESGVKFGTSGARGLAEQMNDKICYIYTVAFIQYLEQTGELEGFGDIAVGGRSACKHGTYHDGCGKSRDG